MMINKIILASSSPRRKEILENLHLPFKIVVPECDEDVDAALPPEEYVSELALRKGRAAVEKMKKLKMSTEDALIISCDTIVYYPEGNIIIGKPKDEREAFLTLGLLSDSWHSVYSGLCMINGDKEYCQTDMTRVKFRFLEDKQIEEYMATGEPYGKAGSYAAQMLGSAFVERVDGDFFNVVGLPVALMCTMLKACFQTDVFELADRLNGKVYS